MPAPLVLIDLPIHHRWMRHVFTGISAYARKHTNWSFTFTLENPEIGAVVGRRHPPDAVIGRNPTEELQSVPSVWMQPGRSPAVHMDHVLVGCMACEHLLERGYRHLAAFNTGDVGRRDRHERVNGFIGRARGEGLSVAVFDTGPRTRKRGRWLLEDQIADLIEFLRHQPKPVGLFACDADHTLRALLICREGGLNVPGDVAILGGADDDLVFAHTRPGLSAVVHDQERMGFEAAKTLHAILEGRPHSEQILIPPRLVAARGSTDWTAVSDPFCEQALRYIRDHLDESLKVGDLARTFHVSESTLVRRFQAHLGHSPVKEIAHARVEAAKTLLLTTDTPLAEIALDCGFSGQPHFQREFKKATGMTPGQVRKAHGVI